MLTDSFPLYILDVPYLIDLLTLRRFFSYFIDFFSWFTDSFFALNFNEPVMWKRVIFFR